MLFWGIWAPKWAQNAKKGEIVGNSQKIFFFHAVLGHLGTPKWT
jgi:hypothetical protein